MSWAGFELLLLHWPQTELGEARAISVAPGRSGAVGG